MTCSYLVTEFVEAEDALHYFTHLSNATPQAIDRAKSLLDVLHTLRAGYIYHGDMKATNFMFNENRIMVIDLDQTKIFQAGTHFLRLYQKDLNRFIKNWEGYPLASQIFNQQRLK